MSSPSSTPSVTSHLKKGISDLENAIILKLVKFVTQNENTTTVDKLYALRSNLSINQREFVGYPIKKYTSFLNKHSDIFTLKNSIVKIRPEVGAKIHFLTNTSLRNETCTVERADVGYGFLLTSNGETVFFGANVYQDGRTQNLPTVLKAGDKVIANAKLTSNHLNAHWQASTVKKITENDYKVIDYLVEHVKSKNGSACVQNISLPDSPGTDVRKFVKTFSKYFQITNDELKLTGQAPQRRKVDNNNKQHESRVGIPGVIVDKYSAVLENGQIIPIEPKIWTEGLFGPGNNVLCNAELTDGGWIVTKMNAILPQKTQNPIYGAARIENYVGAISHLYGTFGLIQYGKCKDDFIYFNQDSVLIGGRKPAAGKLKNALSVGDVVTCNAQTVSNLPYKHVAHTVALETKSSDFSWDQTKKIFNCFGHIVKLCKDVIFVHYRNGEKVYVKRAIFYHKAENQVDDLTDLHLNEVIYFDAEEGARNETCKWRAIVAWTKPDLKGSEKPSIRSSGTVLFVSESEGLISIGERPFTERVLFSVNCYYHCGERVSDLSKVLAADVKVNFEADVNTSDIQRTKWVASLVWTGTRPADSSDASQIQNCEGEISKINIKNGVIKFASGEVLFSVDDFYQDEKKVQCIDWAVKVGEKIRFDAVDRGEPGGRKWMAVLVWKGAKPKVVTKIDKIKKVEEELIKICPLVYHCVPEDRVEVVTVPKKVEVETFADVVAKAAPKSEEEAEIAPKKRKRTRAKKNAEIATAVDEMDGLPNCKGRVAGIVGTENGYLRVEDEVSGRSFIVRFNIPILVNGRCMNWDQVEIGGDYYFDAKKCDGEWVTDHLWASDLPVTYDNCIHLDLKDGQIQWMSESDINHVEFKQEFVEESVETDETIADECKEAENVQSVETNETIADGCMEAEKIADECMEAEKMEMAQLVESEKAEKSLSKKQKKRRRYKELRKLKQSAMENLELPTPITQQLDNSTSVPVQEVFDELSEVCEHLTDDNCDNKHNVRHTLVVLPHPIRSDILAYLSQSGIKYFEATGCLKNYCNRHESGNSNCDTTLNDASAQTVFTGQISGSNIYHDVD